MNPLRTFLSITLSVLFAVTSVPQLIGQSSNPFAGTWVVLRGKSDYDPPVAFFSRSIIIESVDNGWKCVVRTVSDRRQTFETTYTAHFDGKDAPIDVSNLDTVALRRIDADTIERTGKVKDKVVETALMKLSDGGKVLTITTKGSINGENYSSTEVFNRQ
jgi:hypothetical protein